MAPSAPILSPWRPVSPVLRLFLVVSLFSPLPEAGAQPGEDHPSAPAALLPVSGHVLEPSPTIPSDFQASPQVEVFGNFETAGVIASLPEGMAADSVAGMRCFLNVGGAWAPVHPLVQVGTFPWFATSLFGLKPGCVYQVKVEVAGTDGTLLATWFGAGETRPDPVLPELRNPRYVAPNGNDADAGTREAPFRTLARAFAVVRAGETVVARGGTYHEGQLEFTHDGQDGAPIVVRAEQGEQVILDGSEPAMADGAAWTETEDRIREHPYPDRTSNASVEELATGRMIRLFPVPTEEELRTRTLINGGDGRPVGTFADLGIEGAVFTDGTVARIALPQGIGPYRARLPRQHRGIVLLGKRHIRIDGLEFRHYGRGPHNTAIMVSDSSDVLIQHCRFQGVAVPISVKSTAPGQGDRVTVQGCAFRDAILEWPFEYMKGSSGVSGWFEGGCVNVDAKFSGRGLVIRRNHIAGMFDGVHLTPFGADEARTNEIDFYRNTIDGCVDDFVEADGFSRNVRIFDNFMNRALTGVSLAQALDGPTFVTYNVLANCGVVPAAQRDGGMGYPFKTNGGPRPEVGSGPMFLYHNTAHTADPDSRALVVKRPKWKALTMRNNIWVGQKAGFELWHDQPSPVDWDYDNLFVRETGAPLLIQAYRNTFRSLADVREGFGWLRHGISAEPGFKGPEAGNYRLRDDSPCLDAGVLIPGINDRQANGPAPDLGAYENP